MRMIRRYWTIILHCEETRVWGDSEYAGQKQVIRNVGRDRARLLMKSLNLKVKQKRKYKVTTDRKHRFPIAENMLNQQFSRNCPIMRGYGHHVSLDPEGWIYLAVVMDLYSRRVVGWAIYRRIKNAGAPVLDDRNQSSTATTGPDPPFGSRQSICKPYLPETAEVAWHDPEHVSQGELLGYAPVERSFSCLKREWTSDRQYRTRQEAIADVREYVAPYYNSRRLHSTLGYKVPMDYEKNT